MKEGRADRKRQAIIGVIFFLPVFYFLSYGPMTVIHYSTPEYGSFNRLYSTLYAPVEWLWLNTALDGYINWYERLCEDFYYDYIYYD